MSSLSDFEFPTSFIHSSTLRSISPSKKAKKKKKKNRKLRFIPNTLNIPTVPNPIQKPSFLLHQSSESKPQNPKFTMTSSTSESSAIDYTNLPTPPRAVADFCLIPVFSPFPFLPIPSYLYPAVQPSS